MELRALRYFVAVADAGTVTGGSATVHVSQPAVSRQIRGLEHELGVTLFARSEGGVRLTAAGTELLALARDLLEREAFIKRTATSLAAGRLVSLTFAAPPTTLSDVIAPFLASRPADDGASPTPNATAWPPTWAPNRVTASSSRPARRSRRGPCWGRPAARSPGAST